MVLLFLLGFGIGSEILKNLSQVRLGLGGGAGGLVSRFVRVTELF